MSVGIIVIVGVVAIALGVIVGKFIFKADVENKIKEAESQADKIIKEALKDAETLKKEKLMEAKENYLKIKEEKEGELIKRQRRVEEAEARIKGKEQSINQRLENASRKENELDKIKQDSIKQQEFIKKKQEELEKAHEIQLQKLEQIAQLSVQDAKSQLVAELKDKARTDAMAFIKETIDEAKMKAAKEAKKVIINSIQRLGSEHAIENTVSVLNIGSDDKKGQIIGREGRNIRALEAATGVEFIIDDTPEAIVISGYDPYRREIARLSLQRLMADGRIHPARIEEVVAKTEKQMEAQLVEIGERTVIDLGIHGLHPELIKIVGKMRFRSSYGQNLLQHSREVANLCATMASELGLNVKLAKRAGLLHDIGKVSDEDPELSHALLGAKLCEKYGEHPAIVNAVGAHHDEMEMTHIISPIIQACDSISGARPGARREVIETYLKRIQDLETMAIQYKGVQKAFAIQAGRELRVLVESDKMTDKEAEELSFTISQRIQDEMTYPGQIRVTVIREHRSVNVAK